MTDYFRFRFYGSYNFSACTVLVIYDFILENFFKLTLEKLGFLYHIKLIDLPFQNLCSLLKCDNTKHCRQMHSACTDMKMRLPHDLVC